MPFIAQRRALPLVIASIVASAASPALAEEEKITITGHAMTVDQVVNQEELENYQASDLEDIFRQQPEVSVGGGFGTAQKIYVRGIEDTNLNVSIDGAQQAGYLFHHQGRVSIEPELLKRVEVQAGAGLATDGAGALGGAIRFITKDPEDMLREGESVGALVKLGYFDNTDGLKTNASVFGRVSDNVSVLTSFTRVDADEIHDGRGVEQSNTKSEIDSGLIKVVGQLTDDQTLRLSHDFRHDDGTRNVRPHFVSAGWNQANKQESHRDTTNLQYNLNPASDNIDLQANVYYTDAYITQHPTGESKDGAGVKSVGTDIRNTLRSGMHEITFGTDYRRDTGYYINNPNTTGPQQDEVLKVAGLYVQDQIGLTDQLTLNTGLRYDRYDLNDNVGKTFKSSGFSPNLSATYALTDTIDLRAGWARALRGAGVKEAYLLNFATNDPNRVAEKAENVEFGIDYNEGNLSARATAYITKIDNAVTRTSRSIVGNEGDVEVKGISAYLGYHMDNTDFQLGLSHNRPEIDGKPLDDGDMAIGTSIGDTLTASVNHTLPEYNLEMGWSAELVKRLTDLPANRKEKAGYGVHDVFVKWVPENQPDWSVTLTVKNLFDKYYLNHASYGVSTSSGNLIGLAEPGRDIRLTVAARF